MEALFSRLSSEECMHLSCGVLVYRSLWVLWYHPYRWEYCLPLYLDVRHYSCVNTSVLPRLNACRSISLSHWISRIYLTSIESNLLKQIRKLYLFLSHPHLIQWRYISRYSCVRVSGTRISLSITSRLLSRESPSSCLSEWSS